MADKAPHRPLLPGALAALTTTPAGVWKLLAKQVELTNRGVSIRPDANGETSLLIPREVARSASGSDVLNRLANGSVSYNTHGTAFVSLTKENRRWTTRNAAEAWEILSSRGIIPVDAVDDPRRRFACSECDARGGSYFTSDDGRDDSMMCSACEGAGIVPHPCSLPDVVSIASAWPSVVTAEALATETHRAHGIGHAFERVVWHFGDAEGAACLTPAKRLQSLGFTACTVIGGAVMLVCPRP